MDNIKEFIRLADFAERILNDDFMSWETKYGLIFSSSISGDVFATGITFDWLDMDTSYEEDVTNYVNALMKKSKELVKISDENQEEKLTEKFIMQSLFDKLSEITLQFDRTCKYYDDGWVNSEDWELIERCEEVLSISKHSKIIEFE